MPQGGAWNEPRARLSNEHFAGRVVSWKGSYGWIESLELIAHEAISQHDGKIFVHIDDILVNEVRGAKSREYNAEGPSTDGPAGGESNNKASSKGKWNKGLGAELVQTRSVVRSLLPLSEGQRLFGDDGNRIAEFEDRHGITLRAFEWYNKDDSKGTLPLLLEIWGRPHRIVTAIRALRNLLFCDLEFLIPQSRVNFLDLQRLHEVSGCEFKMSTLTAIDDPMPCYPLSCTKGDDKQVGHAVLELIEQICDQ